MTTVNTSLLGFRGGGSPSPMKQFLLDLALLSVSALLFALSFPSFASKWGWFPLAFVALVPVPIVIHRNGWIANILFGFLYGYGTYALFNYWLAKFHPLAHIIVPVIYAAYFVVLFPALKFADTAFPRYGYLVQMAVWLAYEYLRTLGFLGYSYGIIGYSQYLFLPLARVSAVTGVWGVSLLVVFPSFFIGSVLRDGIPRRRRLPAEHRKVLLLYAVLTAAALAYGLSQRKDFSESEQWRVALLQQNVDPWKGGVRAYRKSLDIHTRLSRQAEKEEPDVIIWSETAFVPGIDWHTRYRTDQDSYELVKELREFLAGRPTPYVIGNDDGQLAVPGLPPINPDGSLNRLDYNAVLLYEDGEIVDTYRKIHLVPFTEGFPFEEQLPGIYQWLKNADTHFWEKGEEFTVFETGGVRYSTPICFEDTFGYISRAFVRRGAQVIANVTNDSWSMSVAAEMQHMAMSVFRALENKRTVVRATNGGITCVVLPNGRIPSMLEPFVEGYLVDDVPVYDAETTLYTRWGDWCGILAAIAATALLVLGGVRSVLKARSFRKHEGGNTGT